MKPALFAPGKLTQFSTFTGRIARVIDGVFGSSRYWCLGRPVRNRFSLFLLLHRHHDKIGSNQSAYAEAGRETEDRRSQQCKAALSYRVRGRNPGYDRGEDPAANQALKNMFVHRLPSWPMLL
jgi:hypothetical protein